MTQNKHQLNVTANTSVCVKKSNLAVTNSNGDLLFPFTPGPMIGARHKKIRYQVLALLDGKRTVGDVYAALKQKGYKGSLEDILHVVQRFSREKLLELNDEQIEAGENRYSRQKLFLGSFAEDGMGFCAEIQRSLQGARIAVVGIGGIGSHVLLSLMMMGVGSLDLIDGDRVSLSNLNRQLFYSESDVGRKKIDVLREKCQQYNDGLSYTYLHRHLSSAQDFCSLMKDCDLVVMAADTPRDRIFAWSHEAAMETMTPVLYTQGVWLDKISVGPLYIPRQTSCFHCFFPFTTLSYTPMEFEHINNEYQHGSFMPYVAIAGQIIALEAVKHLTGFHQCQLYNQVITLDMDTYLLQCNSESTPECPWCIDHRKDETV